MRLRRRLFDVLLRWRVIEPPIDMHSAVRLDQLMRGKAAVAGSIMVYVSDHGNHRVMTEAEYLRYRGL